jgi:Tfp pilus assembly protein PilN
VTATERFKALYANAVERICVLEEQLEKTQARIAELEAANEQTARDAIDAA